MSVCAKGRALLTSSSGKEARCCSCRQEQEVFHKFELLVSVLPESCLLFGINPVYFEVYVSVCMFSCASVFLS